MSVTLSIEQKKGIEREACRKVSFRAALPVLGVLTALITEYLIPASPKLKNPELRHYEIFLLISLAVTVILFLLSVFNEKLRERLSHKGAFTCGVYIFFDGFKSGDRKIYAPTSALFSQRGKNIQCFF